MARVLYDHHTAAEDDYTAAVQGGLRSGTESARLRALLSLSQAQNRSAAALELANDLTALNTPGLLDEAEELAVRARARAGLALG